MASMADVARACGVSIRTVSRAFSKGEYIHPATRERVMAAAQKLGFEPNLAARSLRTGLSYEILALAGDMDELHTRKMAAFEAAVRAAGYAMHILFPRRDSGDAASLLQMVARVRPAAVVLFPGCGISEDRSAKTLRDKGIAFVTIDAPGGKGDTVLIDRAQGVYDAVTYLAEKGHRFVAYAGPSASRSRLDGFERAVAEHGLRSVLLPSDGVEGLDAEGGREAARRWLACRTRPTAVQTFSDVFAMGFLSVLYEAGVRVPDDVAVVGFDDRFFAALAYPALTTVAQPNARVGEAAAEMVLKRLSGDDVPRGRWECVVPTRLVVRASA